MKKITVELMQHTPMIHFQYDQIGATLRASEVKPKLDRYLLNWLGEGNGGYKAGCKKSEDNGWLVGSGSHPALDYKMRFKAKDACMTNITKREMETFPLVLANIGNDKKNKMVYFTMHKTVTMTLTFFSKDYIDKKTREKKHRGETWYEMLKLNENLPKFFATTNFGQRSNKGFGSFTVKGHDNDVNINDKPHGSITVKVDRNNNFYDKHEQEKLFERINRLWIYIGKEIKKDKGVSSCQINSMESYIKCMKVYYCNPDYKISKKYPRLPTPIFFKPIWVGNHFQVNVFSDEVMLQRLRMEFTTSEGEIEHSKTIDPMESIVLYPDSNWLMDNVIKIINEFKSNNGR